jgi:hypothetical protein
VVEDRLRRHARIQVGNLLGSNFGASIT